MNNLFAAKLLQNLNNKKGKKNKGFTLIELLVVVIIIGVLAAVALPNLLGQVGKARESEAKSTVGALNRAQQAYYTEKAAFADSTDVLEVPTGNEKYYTISVAAAGIQLATNANNATDGTKDYVGGVSYNSDNRTFATVLCRATDDPDFLAADTDIADAGVVTGTTEVACTGDTETIK
jgi:type IV pilus assembly protein PilA